jgi:cell division protein FtsA
MTKLRGLRELAQAVFHGIPVRVGFPRTLGGLFDELNDPAFSTVVGLLLYRVGEHTQYEIDNARRLLHGKKEDGNPDDDLTNIRLREKEETVSEDANDLFRGKTIEAPNWDDKETRHEKNFSFDDLTRPEENEQGAVGRFTNWLKQLF